VNPGNRKIRAREEKEFLKILFGDADLANTIGRNKSEWTFQSLSVLEVIMEYVPGFRCNTRSIVLGVLLFEGKYFVE
jgi:hypothetical protein